MSLSLRFLICDGDPDSRVAARKAVQRAGQAIAGEISYGIKAVSEAHAARPDAILIAVEEPAALALDTAQALASAFPDIPLVVYSSLSDPESIRRAMVIGARDYIVKPMEAVRVAKAADNLVELERRRSVRQSEGALARGMVITVTGAKGGIGKTVMSVNLALAILHLTGKNVLLVDANTHFGDVATMLDLTPQVTLADVLGESRLDRTNVSSFVTKHLTGLDVLAGPPNGHFWEGRQEDLRHILDVLPQVYDFVIVDTAGSFDTFARVCIEAATLSLIITTGEVSSVRDTAVAMRLLADWGISDERFKVLLNQRAPIEGVRMEDLRRTSIRELFWEIPYDPHILEGVQTGQPVLQHLNGSVAGHSILNLARRITGNKSYVQMQPQRESLFGGLFKRKSA